MQLIEVRGNVFTADDDYYFCHCISADYEMGAGIAVAMNKRFDIKRQLSKEYGDMLVFPNCIRTGRVYNLVTKRHYYNKPTYYDLACALNVMRDVEMPQTDELVKIAMPRIGCGLDRLEWTNVREIIETTFQNSNVNIMVFSL